MNKDTFKENSSLHLYTHGTSGICLKPVSFLFSLNQCHHIQTWVLYIVEL